MLLVTLARYENVRTLFRGGGYAKVTVQAVISNTI